MSSSHAQGVHVDASGKKSFVPLENNPAIFTQLIQRLGLSPELGCFDVYSVDDGDLLSMIPRPVHALIFISPSDVWRRVRLRDDVEIPEADDDSYNGEPVMWFEQTIGNACGLYALIHGVANGTAKQHILPGSLLDGLLKKAESLPTVPRAAVLYDSEELEHAHMAVAVQGDSKAPRAEEKVGYHFISFTKGQDGHLWELEGCTRPLDRGELATDEDLLSKRAIEQGVRHYLNVADGDVEFSIVAVAPKS